MFRKSNAFPRRGTIFLPCEMVSKAKSWLVFAIFLFFIGIVMTLGLFGRKLADSAVGAVRPRVFLSDGGPSRPI